MDRKRYRLIKKILAVFLTVVFLFQPLIGVGILAEGETTPEPTAITSPEPLQNSQEPTQAPQTTQEPTVEPQNPSPPAEGEISPTPSEAPANVIQVSPTPSNEASASNDQAISITNNNSAEVTNDVSATANTGKNEINPTPTATPELASDNLSGTSTPEESLPEQEESTPTPTEITPTPESNPSSDEDDPCPEASPTSGVSQPTQSPEESSQNEVEFSPTSTPQIAPTPGPVAENKDTPDNSQNEALCKSESGGFVANDNQAEVENEITATASSGQNESIGEETQTIETGDSTLSADLANTVNFNVVGQDFWTEVFNLLGINNSDLDFSNIDLEQKFQEAVLTVLARNLGTGDSSANIATADFLASLLVSNNNIATVSNTLDLSAISGQNSAEGGDGEIYTGSASITANLFNLINTNLIGTNFWFGIFNIFGEQNGDIILPYELQFLQTEIETETETVSAINQNSGENSSNQADALGSDAIIIRNTNEAEVTNNVDILADSGTNKAEVAGSANINTGNATTKVDIRNFINTNIFGNRFVFLLINVFGEWQGALLGWWGDLFSDGETTIATAQLPPSPAQPQESLVLAENQKTGDNSSNTADASSTNNLEVTNNNEAYLTNEIKGQAISGQNQVKGESAEIETGDSSVVANIANFVNTNIIGNNFFFGIINIFGKLCGNILFPRPDLEVVKTADKEIATPGDEVTYTIFYKNSGRLWAKDVQINDILPANFTFISASDGGVFDGGKTVWELGKVMAGQSGSFTLRGRINEEMIEEGILTNEVLITTITDEPNKGNNQASVSLTVEIFSSQPSPTPTVTPGGEDGGVGGPGGQGEGNDGQAASGQVGGSAGPCIPPEAPKAPNLLSATAISSTEVELIWTVVDRASYYLLAYGESSGDYIYGSPNVGNVTSYIVGNLTPGGTYYFVVAAVVDNGCPVSGPFSNELSNISAGGILGVEKILAASEGEIGEGVSSEVGEVAGEATPVCPWWWVVLAAEAFLLAGFYGFILLRRKSLKYHWLAAPLVAALVFLADKFAHQWWIPSPYCKYVPWAGLIIAEIETLGYIFFKNRKV